MAPYREFDLGTTQLMDIPTGGEFVSSGFVAPWNANIVYVVTTQSDRASEMGALFVQDRGDSGYKGLYYKDFVTAAAAAKELGELYGPATIWRFQTLVADVLNVTDTTNFRSPNLAFEVAVRTYQSQYRHEYHLIALPAIVHTVAKTYGITVPEFSLDELQDPNQIFNDEFEYAMIGKPKAERGAADHWANSALFQRRTALWAALGESDPLKYLLPESTFGLEKYRTAAADLVACLRPAVTPWLKPVWARIDNVPDPMVSKVSKKGTRISVPVVCDMYFSKEEAIKAIGSTDETTVVGGVPAVPSAWISMETEWQSALGDAVSGGMSLPKMVQELDASPQAIAAWRAYLSI